MWLFPFKYPINCDILYFGGILTNIWIWSGIKCPSIIFTPLYLHNVLMISLISSLYWLYFWCEYNMIFTHPFCMCHRICLIFCITNLLHHPHIAGGLLFRTSPFLRWEKLRCTQQAKSHNKKAAMTFSIITASNRCSHSKRDTQKFRFYQSA